MLVVDLFWVKKEGMIEGRKVIRVSKLIFLFLVSLRFGFDIECLVYEN